MNVFGSKNAVYSFFAHFQAPLLSFFMLRKRVAAYIMIEALRIMPQMTHYIGVILSLWQEFGRSENQN